MRRTTALALGTSLVASALAAVANDDPCAPLRAVGVTCEALPVTVRALTADGVLALRSDPVPLRPGWLTVGCCATGDVAAPSAFAVAAVLEPTVPGGVPSCLATYHSSKAAIAASVAAGEAAEPFAALSGADGMAQQDMVEVRAVVGRRADPSMCGGAGGLAAWSTPLEGAAIVGSATLLFFQVEEDLE